MRVASAQGPIPGVVAVTLSSQLAKSMLPWLAACTLFMGLAVPVVLHAQETPQATPIVERVSNQERLRRLYAEGKYQEVILLADEVLQGDSMNPSAIFYKDRSEKRIASGDLAPPSSPGTGGIINEGAPIAPISDTTVAPVPLAPRQRGYSPGLGSLISAQMLIMIGISLGVILLILAMLLLWRSRRSAAAVPLAGANSMSKAAGPMGGIALANPKMAPLPGLSAGSGRMPAFSGLIGDMPTARSGSLSAPLPDMPTNAMGDSNTSGGRLSPDPVTSADPKTRPNSIADQTSVNIGSLDQTTNRSNQLPPLPAAAAVAIEGMALNIRKEKEASDLGIDYSETDSPMVQSQAADIRETNQPLNMTPATAFPQITSPATSAAPARSPYEMDTFATPLALPPAAPAQTPRSIDPRTGFDIAMPATGQFPSAPVRSTQPAPDATSADALSFNSAMFGAPPAPTKMPDPGATNDPLAASFNSLMFGGDQTKAVPGIPKPSAAQNSDDLTANSFNKEFNNVMFGSGSDETRAPGGKLPVPAALDPFAAPPAPPTAASLGADTLAFAPAGITALPAADASVPKASMFDRQRDAGREAFDKGDFAKAVQCLSVAASLKPGDKEVRDMLEEARKRRRA